MRKATVLKVAAAVLFLGLLIFFSNSGPVKMIRNGSLWILKPFMRIATTWGGGTNFSEEDTSRMAPERGNLKAALAELEKLRSENDSLKKALGFKNETPVRFSGARVLFYSKEFGREFLLIDKGENDGTRMGDLVVDSGRILVGKVVEAGQGTSKVEVASNPDLAFEAELIPARTRALAKGLGGRTFSLELVSADAVLKKGDLVMLSSSPARSAGLLLGELVSVAKISGGAFQEVRAFLLARPEMLQEVFIISVP